MSSNSFSGGRDIAAKEDAVLLLFRLIARGSIDSVIQLMTVTHNAYVNEPSPIANSDGRGLGYPPVKWAFLHGKADIAFELKQRGGNCPGVEGGSLAMAWD
jgi:hypothetical protein